MTEVSLITLPNGETISMVNFTVSGNGIVPIIGTINIKDASATLSAIIGGIPPGTNYLMELSASPDEGHGMCYGASSFDVAPGQGSSVRIDLQCVRTIQVGGMTDYCPSLASYTASSATGVVGGPPIFLTATATSFYSQPPTFMWQASAGRISSEDASVSMYLCTVLGDETLTITVSDGFCTDAATLGITCLAAQSSSVSDAGVGEEGGFL